MSVQINKKIQFFYLTLLFGALGLAAYSISHLNTKEAYIGQLTSENLLLQSKVEHANTKIDTIATFSEMSPLDDPDLGTYETTTSIVDVHENLVDQKNISNKDKIEILKKQIASNEAQLTALKTKNKKDVSRLSQLLQSEPAQNFSNNDITISNLSAKGVRVVNKSVRKSEHRIKQLRVCFSLDENEFIPSGTKKFYIQIVNPRNQIITNSTSYLEKNNEALQFSKEVGADFRNSDLDVCTFVDLEASKVFKGKYLINVYRNFNKIGSTTFEY